MALQNGPFGNAKRSVLHDETVCFATPNGINGLFCNAKWHVWESCKINSESIAGKDDIVAATLQHGFEAILVMHDA